MQPGDLKKTRQSQYQHVPPGLFYLTVVLVSSSVLGGFMDQVAFPLHLLGQSEALIRLLLEMAIGGLP